MKRKILSIISIFMLLLIPIQAFANTEYKSKNLIETLAEEEIELVYKDYKETDDQITIYMFRGTGCGYCKGFLTFLNNIAEEYGKYFKLESYEVWQSKENSDLFVEAAEHLGQQAGGVPFIIIGDKVFPGYAEAYDEDIKTAIKDLYNSKDRYDVFEDIEKAKRSEKINNFIDKITLPVAIIGIMVALIFSEKKYKKLNARINELEEKIEKQNTNNIKEKVKDNKEKKVNKKKDK